MAFNLLYLITPFCPLTLIDKLDNYPILCGERGQKQRLCTKLFTHKNSAYTDQQGKFFS